MSINKIKINQSKISGLATWSLGFLLISAIIIWLAVWQFSDKNLHIYFLDVGQGDSQYVRKMNNFDLLIDGGPDNKVISELGAVMPFWDRKIDYIMLSHPHADHVTGLIEVLKRYQVGQILATDAMTTTNEYLEFLKIVKEKNIPFRLVRASDEFDLDKDVKLAILWPDESFYGREVNNLNNTSVVAKLTYNNFTALFTGDAEVDVQKDLLQAIIYKLQANILKVPHHGSKNGGDLEFLKTVNPEIAVVEVGTHNMFGHPTLFTLDLLKNVNSQIYRTDQNGRIEIISDGQKFWTKTEK